jgi:hypothetical protein
VKRWRRLPPGRVGGTACTSRQHGQVQVCTDRAGVGKTLIPIHCVPVAVASLAPAAGSVAFAKPAQGWAGTMGMHWPGIMPGTAGTQTLTQCDTEHRLANPAVNTSRLENSMLTCCVASQVAHSTCAHSGRHTMPSSFETVAELLCVLWSTRICAGAVRLDSIDPVIAVRLSLALATYSWHQMSSCRWSR